MCHMCLFHIGYTAAVCSMISVWPWVVLCMCVSMCHMCLFHIGYIAAVCSITTLSLPDTSVCIEVVTSDSCIHVLTIQ